MTKSYSSRSSGTCLLANDWAGLGRASTTLEIMDAPKAKAFARRMFSKNGGRGMENRKTRAWQEYGYSCGGEGIEASGVERIKVVVA